MNHRIVVLGAALLIVGSACSEDDDAVVPTVTSMPTPSVSVTTTRDELVTTTSGSSTVVTTAPSTTGAVTTTAVTTTIGTTAPTTAPEDFPVVEPPGPGLVASDLRTETGCDEADPSMGFAQLGWLPAREGGVQRVQVSADARGFDGGVVVSGPELADDVDAFRWLELQGQAVHTWRVITASPDRSVWYPSAEMQFEGPLCAVDYQDG